MKRHLLGLLVGILCGVTAAPASAEMSANEMIGLFRKGDVRAQFFLRGMGNALSWANTTLLADKQPALFCTPESIVLTVEQEVDIMARHIERVPENGKVPAGGVMLYALREAFPCKP
jgi:hypothetical protein